jgi:DNA-directed RNA polymerase specialized sigma24 family protein
VRLAYGGSRVVEDDTVVDEVEQGSDSDLLRRIALGDSAAEDDLFNKYVKLARAIGRKFGLSEADAQEVASDVLLDTLHQARQKRLRAPVRPWLIKVAANRAIDWKRARVAEGKHQTEAAGEFLAGLESRGGDAKKDIVVPYPRVAVRRALQEIRAKEERRKGSRDGDAEILVWVGHGASNSDLAEYLGISENAARQRRKRALDRFEVALGAIYVEGNSPISSEQYEEL